MDFFQKLRSTQTVNANGIQKRREIYDLDYIAKIIDLEFINKRISEITTKYDEDMSRYDYSEYIVFTVYLALYNDCVTGKVNYKDRNWYEKG